MAGDLVLAALAGGALAAAIGNSTDFNSAIFKQKESCCGRIARTSGCALKALGYLLSIGGGFYASVNFLGKKEFVSSYSQEAVSKGVGVYLAGIALIIIGNCPARKGFQYQ